MDIKVNEITMRRVGRPLVAFLFLLPVVPILSVSAVVLGTSFLRSSEPEWVLQLLALIQGWNSVPKDIVSLAVSSTPALAGTVLFRATHDERSERLARWLIGILGLAVVSSVLCLMFLDPGSKFQAGAITGGPNTLMRLELAAEASLRLGTTYCLLLLGVRVNLTLK